jgi:hypothetical protein
VRRYLRIGRNLLGAHSRKKAGINEDKDAGREKNETHEIVPGESRLQNIVRAGPLNCS